MTGGGDSDDSVVSDDSDDSDVIALFPLSHVLLPGMPLPLHIFEQRYREMLADLDAAGTRSFGVIALRSGTEAGGSGPVEVVEVGTLAEILEIERSADGTADLLAVGSRRFRIRRLLTDRATPDETAYLRAEVDFLVEDDGPVTGEVITRSRELMAVFDSMLERIAGRGTGSELPADAAALSYQLAARLPLAPAEKQALLEDETSAQRLTRVARLLRREIALVGRTRSIAVSPAVLRMGAGPN